uniref:Testis cDNA clone: QtsA-15602, similar to human coagulation factor XII (Hageman factor) (F12) n=1 Tax=Macaca fascicularis TaxID=9541 RepID=Q4R3P1_MACFA|nr:unnamed protein product [Macaca fascicularis]
MHARVIPEARWCVRTKPQSAGSPCKASSAGDRAVVTATSQASTPMWPTTWPGSGSTPLPDCSGTHLSLLGDSAVGDWLGHGRQNCVPFPQCGQLRARMAQELNKVL